MAIGTAYWLFQYPIFERELDWFSSTFNAPFVTQFILAYTLVFFVMAWLLLLLSRKWADHWLFKKPVRNLFLFYTGMLVLASYAPLPRPAWLSLWVILIIAGKYLWFLAYALSNRGKEKTPVSLIELFHFQPFWGSTNVPFPKGEANLRKIEAKSPLDLATVQLKGLKLMLWSSLLLLVFSLFDQIVFGAHGFIDPFLQGLPVLPRLNNVIHQYLVGKVFPRSICWMVLVANFLRILLDVSSFGGTFVATCRMCGFNALRNTYKPLEAKSIAEFYNRVYYYFKELLVDFFFYPTYFRFFKQHPRLRIFFATFAAAGFGNALFHFLRDITLIIKLGLWNALAGFQTYLLYCVILGTAIGVSQLRSIGRPPQNRGFLSTVFVLFFYCLIMVLDDPLRSWSIIDYCSFIINLFLPFAR
ncbi:MAG: hypothetical protein HQM09_19240 [Candidatus Riflebacteria bacterium]|nr:hypothetical protein [Candidatus Riflebacteria bacterium]